MFREQFDLICCGGNWLAKNEGRGLEKQAVFGPRLIEGSNQMFQSDGEDRK